MLHRSFKPAKCKTSLKLAASRLKLMKNKKEVQLKQMRRELAQLLESGEDQTARIRVEHVVREEKTMAAYDLLEIYCELIVARLPIIESQKNCPIDLKEAITSVIFASPRCADIPELMDVRKHFNAKYGKEFITAAVELRPDCGVSRMLVEKLSAIAPDGQTKIKILSAIADEHNIKWEPKSFGEKELKPPDDLLNGPNTFEKASKMHAEPPIAQAHPSNVQAPPSPGQKHNAPVNFDQYTRSSTSPQTFASTDIGGDQTTNPATFPAVRPSGTGSDRMEVRHSHSGDGSDFSSDKQNWNMEFKDATAAAQAAAESAERASMAARAAAELSSRGKITRQYSTESKQSNIHGLRNEGPRKNTTSKLPSEQFSKDPGYNSFHDRNSQIQTERVDGNEHVNNPDELAEGYYRDGHRSTKRSSQSASLRSNTAPIDDDKLLNDLQKSDRYSQKSSFEEEVITAEKSAFVSEMSINKQSSGSDVEFVSDQLGGLQSENFNYFGEETISKQASNVSSHSHSSNHGDDYDVPHYSHHNFGTDAGKDTFLGIDQGNIHGDIVHTSSYDNAAVVFDESGSDDDDFRFDTRPGYDEQESRLYSTSPGRESAAHLSGNTDTWRTRQNISGSLDKSSSLLHGSAEWHSPPEINESLTKSAHPSQPDDLLPVNFDDSEGPDSESEDELDMSRFGGKTDPSSVPRKQNIYFRNPDHIQRESHGLTGSSVLEKGDSGSNRKQDLLDSSNDEELVVVSPEKNQGMEFSAQSSTNLGFDEVHTHQSSSRRTNSRLASNDMVSEPFYNPVEEGKRQQTPQSSRLSLVHEVKDPDNTCTPDSPDAMKDNEFFDQSSLESGNELKFGTLRGGLRNKGNRRPPYTPSPSGDVSSSSKKATEDSVTTIEHSSTASPAAMSSLNSGVRTRVKYESSSPIPRKDSDTDDTEEELPQRTSRSKRETYNPKAGKEVNTKSRFRAPVTFFDSDDGDSEEDLPKQTVTSTGRAGSGVSRRTKATPSSYSKARVSSEASISSHIDAEKISSKSSYGSETPWKTRYQTVNSGDWGSSSEPSLAKQATSKPMPDSSISMRRENLKSSVMEQPSSPLKTVASGSTESDRSRSPYSNSHSRRRSRSCTPRCHRSPSPALRRRRSRSPTSRRHKRQKSRSTSLSPLPKSRSSSLVSTEHQKAIEKLRKEEEEKKRHQLEAELKLLEEETARRVEESIRKKVQEKLNSEEVKLEIEKRIEEGRKKLFHDVEAQLEKEKEAALTEARQKEKQARKEREELDKMLEENRRRVEESQRREALELQRKEEERYWELEMIQRQKEEAARRKKLEEEEERASQMRLLGKNKSRPKLSFGMSL